MKTQGAILAVFVIFLLLALCSCGPFGAGPWYAIYESTQKDKDKDVGVVRITSGPDIAALTNDSATIEWITDIQSDSSVEYGPDASYGSQEVVAALDTAHSVILSGLSSNATYHFRVASRAANGATGASSDFEFTTKVALTITSDYGPTTPTAGTHYYDSGDDVFASAPETVAGPAKTRYRCTGWTGTGSAPSGGTDTSAFFTIDEDSTLTWNWVTQYYLATSSNPIGSGTIACSPLGNWHDDGSTPQMIAAGNAGYAFINWTGDLSGSNNPDTLTVDAPKTIVANFTGETFTLTVSSLYGSPDPAIGPHICASGADIEASVDTPVSGGTGTRYVCIGWTGTGDVDLTGTTNSTSFTITQDSTITWEWKTQYQLTTTINPVGAGGVSRSPDAAWYDASTMVQLTATENPSFTFSDWSGDLVSVSNPDNITMDSAKTVAANFTGGGTFWNLTVTSAYGTPDPPTSSVADGTLVDASVDSPVSGPAGTRYVCTGWDGTGSVVPSSGSTSSVSFTITEDSTLTWNWKTQYQLTTSVSPVGGGNIARSPSATWYDDGTPVQLTASPSASYVFDSWSGALTGSSNPDNITMDGPKSVTATFTTSTYTLTVVSDHGTPDPPDGSQFTSGTNVNATVDATVAGTTGERYACTGWVGSGSVPATGLTNSANFDITQDSSITWQWQLQYQLAASASPPAGGTVQLTPPGGWYVPSTSVDLMVIVNSSYSFTSWSGDLSGSANPENLMMDGPKTVVANCTLNANVITVPGDYATIQAAIDAAANGDIVLVADGTWKGTGNRNLDFKGKEITVKSENGPANCTIDCQNAARGFYFHYSENENSILEGFTIKDGDGGSYGGAIRCSASSPRIDNCIITGCQADYGGGIYCNSGSNPKISDCRITGNAGQYNGGGIYCDSSSPILTDCVIENNSTDYDGGGMYLQQSNPELTKCTISGNSANEEGGGIYCQSSSSPTVTDCLIASNTADKCGGGLYCWQTSNAVLTNCTIADNTAKAFHGGGVHCSLSTVRLENSVLCSNTAGTSGNQINVFTSSSSVILDYCSYADGSGDVEGDGTVTPTDCINSDPMFASVAGENYRLMPDSPCVNTGDNIYVNAGDKDLDGRDRIINTTVDMGCYEFNALNVPSGYFTIQEAIDAAETGDTVVVADGTYQGEGNKDLDFAGKLIVVCSENGPASCIIDCEDNGRGFYFHSGETLGSVVAGFTIKNGQVAGNGGGIYCNSASPTITNCVITDNTASINGGGFWIDNWSDPTVTNCMIEGNSATSSGGGVYCYAVSNPTFVNCLIANNTAGLVGGGICCNNYSSPTLTNCTLADNTATTNNGGGLYCYDHSSPTLSNTIFWGNTAGVTGYQIYTASADLTVTLNYCDYSNGGGDVTGSGTITEQGVCIYTNPLFASIAGENYRLMLDSPCRNAGDNSYVTAGDKDLDGRDRIIDTTVDMGCYEFNVLNVPATYSTIQDAIDAAQKGDTVVVADGTYTGVGNKNLDFKGKLIVVCSESGPAGCIIDCQDSGRGFTFHSGETLGSVVAGFMIRNGYAEPGGGIRCDNSSSPKIFNCVLEQNSADTWAGGIHCANNSNPVISNCAIIGNTVGWGGGGICCLTGSSPIIDNCTIANNDASEGGGTYSKDSNPVLNDTIVWGNNASFWGNEIAVYGSGCTVTLNYCDYADGSGDVGGSITPSNCTNADPLFVTGPKGSYYLSQTAAGQGADSPCIDAGSDTAAKLGLDTKTTRTDAVADSGTVDIGYHYDP